MRELAMGEVFRTAGDYDPGPETVDVLPNFWNRTVSPDGTRAVMMAGINGLAEVSAVDGPRIPAILIRSTPHKAGSAGTPWQDHFDSDNGHIRYFGDNKVDASHGRPAFEDPSRSTGNALLLRAQRAHQAQASDDRLLSDPVLFFRTPASGRVQFEGFGVIERASVVSQRDPNSGRSFSNYVYDFLVLDLAVTAEKFPWSWIEARRSPELSRAATNRTAPQSWRDFMDKGMAVAPRVRRRVSRTLTSPATEQRPARGSPEARTLEAVYDYYRNRKTRFEGLAEVIAERILAEGRSSYRAGWVTRAGSDGGADFIGRLDIGSGFGAAKLVVLGQAKCEKLDQPTGGNHIARTVARLRRGWVGVYVTTSYFSEAVQREVYEDDYPVVLVHGLRVATELNALALESGRTVLEVLDDVDAQYESRVQHREPTEILLE